MSKYYDLDKLKELIEAKAETLIGDGAIAFHAVGKWLDFLPAADVATVQLNIDDVRNMPAVPKPLNSVLDKIRAEIGQEIASKPMEMWDYRMGLTKALDIIDKYREEASRKE